MKINNKKTHKKVDHYSVGDVIADDFGIYLVCRTDDERFALVNLGANKILKRSDSLERLFQANREDSDRVLKAKLLIKKVM